MRWFCMVILRGTFAYGVLLTVSVLHGGVLPRVVLLGGLHGVFAGW